MARALRIEFSGALYHITSRGNEKRSIFRFDPDRHAFLEFLADVVHRFGWRLSAWVLMTNHFHLLVQTPEPNLSRGMHRLNGRYGGWFNRRHRRVGHLYQGRYDASLIEKSTYFTEVLRYIVLNPVRANMVSRPEDYDWSSYRATAGLDPAPTWLDVASVHESFDSNPKNAQQLYRDFVHARVDEQHRLWDEVVHRMYLGSDGWAREMRTWVESKPRSTDHPTAERTIGRPTMRAIIEAASEVCEQSTETICSERKCSARALVAWIGRNEGLLTLRSIAAALRLRSETQVINLSRKFEKALEADPNKVVQLDQTLTLLKR